MDSGPEKRCNFNFFTVTIERILIIGRVSFPVRSRKTLGFNSMSFFNFPHCQKDAISYLEMAYTPFVYSSNKQCAHCKKRIKFKLSVFMLYTALSFLLFAPFLYIGVKLYKDFTILIFLFLVPFLFVFQLWLSPMILNKFGARIFNVNE